MDNPAVVDNLTDLGWSGDSRVAQGWLDAAWVVLTAKITNLDDLVADSDTPLSTATVAHVVTQMTLRVLRNLRGEKQASVTIDDATRSWTLDDRVASGFLYVTDDELGMLHPGGSSYGKAFSVIPC